MVQYKPQTMHQDFAINSQDYSSLLRPNFHNQQAVWGSGDFVNIIMETPRFGHEMEQALQLKEKAAADQKTRVPSYQQFSAA